MSYLKSLTSSTPQHYTGHNPPGGWMVLALLTSLILTSVTGLQVYGLEGYGPLADTQLSVPVISSAYADADEDSEYGEQDHEEDEAEELWEEIHEFFANLTLLLVFVHVTGVITSSLLHRENLVRVMFTGKKRGA